ncbi:conserved hypothetical protein [Candidatus Sulfopaludibacter sp. SbA3]|nr:conserved hypothetical protein [Candidatus Sulfopaludibacter sp. SbA3]
MSVNSHQPHIFVLPEDRANSEIANGFLLNGEVSTHRIQVLGEAGGWHKVLTHFKSQHVSQMDRFPKRFMILLIDFDGRGDRMAEAKGFIPDHLSSRVFVLGAWTEPEDLKRANLGSFETIGRALAKDCREDTYTTWSHDLLRHNSGEIERLRQHVRPILFP